MTFFPNDFSPSLSLFLPPSQVYNLFTRRGLTILLNDNLIGRVLFLGSFMVGLLTCGIGVLLAFALRHTYLKDVEDAPSLLGGAGFVVRLSPHSLPPSLPAPLS